MVSRSGWDPSVPGIEEVLALRREQERQADPLEPIRREIERLRASSEGQVVPALPSQPDPGPVLPRDPELAEMAFEADDV